MELGLFDEAEVCLMTVHNSLLQSAATEPKPCNLRRMRLLRSANDSLDRLTDELSISDKLEFYRRSREQGAIKNLSKSASLH